ncbi:MAG: AEC family transporter [Clostridia bacterium]|nr:AEC family transporter [Clostridia bacterium]
MATIVFNMMLTMFLLSAVGYICRKGGLIDTAFSKKLSRLIVEVGQPMLIIASVVNTEYSREKLLLGFSILGIGILVHLALALAAFLYSLHIKDFNEAKMTSYMMIFANCGFLGLPVLGAMLGSDGLFCGAFYVIAFNLFLWSYGMILLGRKRTDIKLSPKKMLLNFGTVPCAIGIILYVLKPYFVLPSFLADSLTFLGNLCTPISQLIVGGLIAMRPLKQLFNSLKLYSFTLTKLFVIPIIALFVCKLLGLNEFMTYFITIVTAFPCATNATMFGEIYDIVPEYAAQVVGITSVASVLSIPVVMKIAEWVIAL